LLFIKEDMAVQSGTDEAMVEKNKRAVAVGVRVSGLTDVSEKLSSEMKRRKQAEQTLRERLLFEELLSAISARFINLSVDRIDAEIHKAMMEVLNFFKVDRFALIQVCPNQQSWVITHSVSVAGVPSVPIGEKLTVSINPWAYEKLVMKREVLSFSKMEDVPAEAEADKKTWMTWGIRSNLNIPIIIGEPVDHVIVINSVKRERVWPDGFVPRLRLLGEIFVNALERSKAQKSMRESEDCLNLATSAAEVGLWMMDMKTDRIWATPMIRELFSFSPDEELSRKRFMEVIHPDDQERVREFVSQNTEAIKNLRVEYRILKPDGGIRWILTRGRPYGGVQGSSSCLMGVSMDITERKQMELQLNWSEALHDALINSTSDMIWSVDPERFGLLTFNRRLYEYFSEHRGIRIEAGMRPEDLFPDEEYIRRWRSFYLQALEEGSFTTEYPVYAGNRILKLNLNILKGDGRVFGIAVFGQDITELKRMENKLRDRLAEIEKLKTQLEKENLYLREEMKTELGFGKMIGCSDTLQYVLFRAQQVAPTDATVLILGETGVGKGMVAHAIHEMSARKDKPMVTVNCAALPGNLIESELFGREKGAFTGAHARQIGRFEVADSGTIFLDEIGELPLELQAKLLRVLQDGEFERLGSPRTVKVDVRVIASTSRDLKEEMHNGRFREDLYYRLNTFPVTLPPLRMRVDDIPELAKYFIDKYARKFGRRFESLSKDTTQKLSAYSWPGNVRELEHVIERAVITSAEPVFQLTDRLENEPAGKLEGPPEGFEAMAREHILQVLQKTGWKIEGKDGAAAILGLNPSTLRFRIKKLGLKRP